MWTFELKWSIGGGYGLPQPLPAGGMSSPDHGERGGGARAAIGVAVVPHVTGTGQHVEGLREAVLVLDLDLLIAAVAGVALRAQAVALQLGHHAVQVTFAVDHLVVPDTDRHGLVLQVEELRLLPARARPSRSARSRRAWSWPCSAVCVDVPVARRQAGLPDTAARSRRRSRRGRGNRCGVDGRGRRAAATARECQQRPRDGDGQRGRGRDRLVSGITGIPLRLRLDEQQTLPARLAEATRFLPGHNLLRPVRQRTLYAQGQAGHTCLQDTGTGPGAAAAARRRVRRTRSAFLLVRVRDARRAGRRSRAGSAASRRAASPRR